MQTPELTLEERDDMYLLLGATTLPTPHVPPTNRQSCIDLHRRGNPHSVARILGAGVQHRVLPLSHNCVRLDRESDVV